MLSELVSVEHTHSIKLSEDELHALLVDYSQAIDGIRVAEDRRVDLWCDVDPDEFADALVSDGFGHTDVIESEIATRDGDLA